MLKNRYLTYIIVIILCISFTGCASLQRKFVRKKKQEKKVSPIVTSYDYSKELRTDELYKKHYLFWKSWHRELIDRIDAGYKKRETCYDYMIVSLMEMKKYLNDVKKEELEGYIIRIKSIDPDIRKKSLSKSESHRIVQLLENTKRQIEKRFSYSDVKDFLESGN